MGGGGGGGQASQPAWKDAEAGDGGNQKTMLGSGIGTPPPTPDLKKKYT